MTEIAVLSGKGGTGKTSLSAALITLCEEVVVADCDVEAANLHIVLQPENYHEEKFISGQKAVIDMETCINCGICMNYCRFDAISVTKGIITISATACDGCMLCLRVCPNKSIHMNTREESRLYAGTFRRGRMVHARLEPGEDNSGKLVSLVRKHARTIAKETGSNIIIIDGPPGLGCPVISSVTGIKKTIVITEPTRSGFHDMKRLLELTDGFKIKAYVVINKFDLNMDISGQIRSWCTDRGIPVAGNIPFDVNVVEAMLNCQTIVEWMPQSDVSNEIRKIWEKVNNDE